MPNNQTREFTVVVYGTPVRITTETIVKTRQWYADNAMACIEGAESGKYRVNDLEKYIEAKEYQAESSLAGFGDHTLAFAQMAVYLQTGKSVPMLTPPAKSATARGSKNAKI